MILIGTGKKSSALFFKIDIVQNGQEDGCHESFF